MHVPLGIPRFKNFHWIRYQGSIDIHIYGQANQAQIQGKTNNFCRHRFIVWMWRVVNVDANKQADCETQNLVKHLLRISFLYLLQPLSSATKTIMIDLSFPIEISREN